MNHKLTSIVAMIFLTYASLAFSGMNVTIDNQQKVKRLALVIGNSSYQNAPLKNPVNDAKDIAATLRTVGFKVIELIDGNLEQMHEAVNEFGETLEKNKGVGLFYYAGHAMQSGGLNYLIPIKAKLRRETDLKYKALDVGKVLDEMGYADNGLNIAILDSCRDNPLTKKFRKKTKGLARLTNVPTGLLIAYSTSPGKQAQDGRGRNSPYTKHLIESMKQSNLPLELVFKRVTKQVKRETRQKQIPWMSSSVDSDFYFVQNDKSAAGVLNEETILWNEIKQTPSIPLYRIYLMKYPDGIFAPIAKQFIAEMKSGKKGLSGLSIDVEEKNTALSVEPNSKESSEAWISPQNINSVTESEVFKSGSFVLVPKGCFNMGSDSAGKNNRVHEVCISRDYYMSKYEVTQGQWQKVMGKNPSYFQLCGLDCPVESVSWNDVQNFINKLNQLTGKVYRLPTESEWEYACTSGGENHQYCGNNDIEKIAWIDVNAQSRTHKVGQKLSNDLGLYDMSGNVFEWVSDWYGEYPRRKSTDPKGVSKSFAKVFRGGSWLVNKSHAMAIKRRGNKPNGVSKTLGLRLILEKHR